MNQYLVFTVGFIAQILFSARLLVQWISSEKAGRVLSPLLFWQLSILASFLLVLYGVLRHDLAILLGQAVTYGIYIRNLYYHGFWKKIPRLAQILIIAFPILAICWLISGETYNLQKIIGNKDIPFTLMLWGLTGQIVFTFRFVLQWFYSEKKKTIDPADRILGLQHSRLDHGSQLRNHPQGSGSFCRSALWLCRLFPKHPALVAATPKS